MNKLLKGLLAFALVAGLVGCSSSKEEEKKEDTPTTDSATKTGEGQGFGGTISVTLTMDGDTITDVKIEGADETPTIGGAALEELAEQVKKANGAEIDGVGGATFTSNGVKEAVENALK